MSIDIQKITTTDVISIPFGMRLKSAREARGLESKDVAAQLRLSEKMISMIERETYPSDLPITFVRGYIRAYARLMEISDAEITKALEPIKLPTIFEEEEHELIEPQPVTSGNYFMQFFTYLILLTIVSLVGVWWYSQSSSDNRSVIMTEVPINQNAPINAANDNVATPPHDQAKEIEVNANKTMVSTMGEENETNLQLPSAELVGKMSIYEYVIQFLTQFILFLLIGFVVLWQQARSLKKSSSLLVSLILLSLISLGSLWWYYYSQFVSATKPWQLKNEIEPANNALGGTNSPGIKQNTEASPLLATPAPEDKTETQPPLPTKIITNDKTANEKPMQDSSQTIQNNSQNINTENKAKIQTTPTSSGQYTPVPSTKKHNGKHRRKALVMAPPVEKAPVIAATSENEFAELDKDDIY